MWESDYDLEMRFGRPENAKVVRYLKKKGPSAHGDLVDELLLASNEIEDRQVYCPDVQKFAYSLLYTTSGIIYAVAVGMRVLAFRLPEAEISNALSSGAASYPELGEGWMAFEPFQPEIPMEMVRKDLKYWCELAFKNASSTLD